MSGSSDMARAYALLGQKVKARQMYDELLEDFTSVCKLLFES